MQQRAGARGLAEHRHVAGIAAEGVDVLLHPLQRGELIAQSVVGDAGQRHEAERTDAVVARHDDDVTALGKARAVIRLE